MSHHDEDKGLNSPLERVDGDGSTMEGQLGDEFREFGRQLIRAMRAVVTSDELKHLGNEIADSLREIGEEVQGTFERTRDKEEVKAVGDQARRVTQSLTSSSGTREVAGDVQQNLSRALRTLNEELNKVIDQVQTRSARVSDEVESSARDAADEAEGAAARMRDNAEAVWDQAKDEAGAVKEEVQQEAEEAADIVEDVAERADDATRGKRPPANPKNSAPLETSGALCCAARVASSRPRPAAFP